MEFTSIVVDQYPFEGEEDRKRLFKRWDRHNAEARLQPIEVPCSLPVVRTFEPFFEPKTTYEEELRWSPMSSPPSTTAPPPGLAVELVGEISCRDGHWSQVYLADVVLPGRDAPIRAAVKLVHEAFFSTARQFDPGYVWGRSEGHFWTAAELMTREVTAYRAAQPLWGKSVPDFHGSFIFKHPCGHLVPGLILEYVEGSSLGDAMEAVCGKKGDEHLIQDLIVAQKRAVSLIRKSAMALHALVSLGVRHGDVASRNILVSSFDPLHPESARAVVFDFGTSMISPEDDCDLDEDCSSLFRAVGHTGFVRGCWRANLRDTREEAVEGGWLAFWREWDDVRPDMSDLDEKMRSYDLFMRLRGHVIYIEIYGEFVLPRWAEELDWSDLTVSPPSEPESDSTASQ